MVLHDPSACVYAVSGCLDSLALNFASDATIPGGAKCAYPMLQRPGCTVPTAYNYDSLATTLGDGGDGGGGGSVCLLLVLGCMDSTALNYAPDATLSRPELCIPDTRGCMAYVSARLIKLQLIDEDVLLTFATRVPCFRARSTTTRLRRATRARAI